MIVNIHVEPLVSEDGIQYLFGESQVLSQLKEWHCYPREVASWAFDDWIGNPRYKESYYSFKRNDSGPEGAVIRVFIPDDHPAAMMAKLKWGGVCDGI